MGHNMSSIHDSFDFIKMVAVCNTSEDIDAIDDPDIRQEVHEEDMQGIRDALDRIINKARALQANHPYDYIDFSAAAIREHYEGYDQADEVAGLTDEDLQDAGEWSLNWDSLWDNVYDAWDYGIAQLRAQKEREEKRKDVNTV